MILPRGLGLYADSRSSTCGGNGWIDTHYEGKAQYALDVLERVDYVYIHVESPDEAGHSGNVQYKLQAIEDLDAKVVGPVLKGLAESLPRHRVLLMPDHATRFLPVPIPAKRFRLSSLTVVRRRNRPDCTYDERIAEREDKLFLNTAIP